MPSRCKKTKLLQGFNPPELQPRLHHTPVVELTMPGDSHLHFTTLQNSIIVKKWTLVNCSDKCLQRSWLTHFMSLVYTSPEISQKCATALICRHCCSQRRLVKIIGFMHAYGRQWRQMSAVTYFCEIPRLISVFCRWSCYMGCENLVQAEFHGWIITQGCFTPKENMNRVRNKSFWKFSHCLVKILT